jgi:hypothetical protein
MPSQYMAQVWVSADKKNYDLLTSVIIEITQISDRAVSGNLIYNIS